MKLLNNINHECDYSLGHIFPAKAAQPANLDTMCARFKHLHSWPLLGPFLAYHITDFDLPRLDRAFHTTIPCSETGFWGTLTRRGDVYERVGEQASAANDLGWGLNVEGGYFDWKREDRG
jgi:hypothetical protein